MRTHGLFLVAGDVQFAHVIFGWLRLVLDEWRSTPSISLRHLPTLYKDLSKIVTVLYGCQLILVVVYFAV